MTRIFARAEGGERAIGKVPRNKRGNISVISTLGLRGVLPYAYIKGAVDGLFFNAFIEKFLLPELKSTDVLVMDRLKIHLSSAVEELINSVGARIIPLPPSSPEFSPIENCISKVKEFLRATEARTMRSLDKALNLAFDSITKEDIRNWFALCGY